MMELSDSQLAARAGQGDADAYRRLFERYQHPVYNFVYRMVDNAEDASDIVQDAFIKVYNVLGRKKVQNFSAYLYRTAKNLAYDEMRRRTRFADVDHEVYVPEDPNIYADPQRALLLGEQLQKVRLATSGLNENQRAALILRELEGLDYDQMAEVMDSNRNAVGALLSRARLKFREELRMAHVQTGDHPRECEAVIALLSPYIDGELSADTAAEVENHLEQCTFCTAALEEMQEASRSFRILIPVIPPADMAEAFTGKLLQARETAAEQGAEGGQQLAENSGGKADVRLAEKPSRPFLSRFISSRFTWIAAALILAVGISVFVLADEVARDGAITSFFADENNLEKRQAEADAQDMNDTRQAQADGTELQAGTPPGEGETEIDSLTPEPLPSEPGTTPPEVVGEVSTGYASPNPVSEYSLVTITVTVVGSPNNVSVTLAGAKTVSLSRQYDIPGGEVWSWSGKSPAYGDYPMTTTAGFSSGSVSAGIGTLKVLYLLY